MSREWILSNQTLFLYLFSFSSFSWLFGFLWAAVILVTIELVENNFEFNIHAEQEKPAIKETKFRVKYLKDSSLIEQELCENTNTFQFGKTMNNERASNGELKPSLMTLIKHGSRSSTGYENREKQQPLLAVVKNNIYLRRNAELSNLPKSPLYKHIINDASPRNSSFGFHSPSINSPKFHGNSGWTNQSNSSFRSPMMSPSVALNKSNIYSHKGTPYKQSPLDSSLEVHGSYFVNKSLLHSNLVEEEQFSLVNSQFNSPRNSAINFSNAGAAKRVEKSSLMDETSTEAVISILKEKSKRKRVHSEIPSDETQYRQHNESSRKKIKYDLLNDTLDQLIPPKRANQTSKRLLNGKNVIVTKKRLASIGTQCIDVPKKSQTTKVTQPKERQRSSYGLSDEQTDEMMDGETERQESPLPKRRMVQSDESSSEAQCLAQTILNMRKTIDKSKNEAADDTKTDSSKSEFSQINNSEIDFQRTPMKQSDAIKELKTQSTALKSLKSPYKKLFNTFPSNLTPGSVEKRRKNPVYFTAKIDVDDIQSHREEYGDRGASLKAFRMDQEEAKKRANTLLDDDDEDQSSNTNPQSTGTTSTIQTTTQIPTFKITPTTSDNGPTKSSGFGLSFSLPSTTPATTITSSTIVAGDTNSLAGDAKITPKKVTFSIPATATTVSSVSFNTPSLSTTLGSGAAVPAASGFGFTPKSSVSATPATTTTASLFAAPSSAPSLSFNLSTKNTFGFTQQPTAASSGFSFANPSPASSITSNAAPAVPPPSFSQATEKSSAPPSMTPFSFGPKPTATSSAAPPPNLFASTANIFGPVSGLSNPTKTTVLPGNPIALSSSISSSNSFQQPTSTASTSSLFAVTSASAIQQPSFSFGQKTTISASTAAISSKPSSGFSFPSSNTTPNIGFSFASSNKPTSTATTTTATPGNIFVAPASSQSAFGAPKSNSSVFGVPATSSQSVFGAPAASSFTTTTNATSTNNVFINPSSQSVFNTAGSSSVFNANPASSSTSLQPAGFVFGPKTTLASTGFNFGASSVPKTTAASSGFSFGTSNNQAPASKTAVPSIFGQNQSTGSVFGQTAPTAPQTSVFGKPAAASATPFGQTSSAGSVFGQQSTTAAPSVFGQANSSAPTNVFGAPSSSSVFGQPSSAPTTFGGQTSTKTDSVFGAVKSTASVNPFGQPQQQQPTNNNNSSSGFNFGSSSQPSFNFGAAGGASSTSSSSNNNVFGAPSTPAKPSFSFGGGGAAQPSFGAPSTPSFGAAPQPSFGAAPQPSFGTPQPLQPFGAGTPSFNSPATPAGGGFTIGAGSNQPPRQGQLRARRRKR